MKTLNLILGVVAIAATSVSVNAATVAVAGTDGLTYASIVAGPSGAPLADGEAMVSIGSFDEGSFSGDVGAAFTQFGSTNALATLAPGVLDFATAVMPFVSSPLIGKNIDVWVQVGGLSLVYRTPATFNADPDEFTDEGTFAFIEPNTPERLLVGEIGNPVDIGLGPTAVYQVVPEPSAIALLGLGALALAIFRRR